MTSTIWQPGVVAALASAALFGAGTPLAKVLLGQLHPWMLAGLLYLGSGVGLAIYRLATSAAWPQLKRSEWGWLVAAIVCGGGIAPVLLMWGLSAMAAGPAALLLNAEAVFTALLAWVVFRENADRRIVMGMAAIVAGAVVLSWPSAGSSGSASTVPLAPALAVLLACLFWALDNNFTRKVSLTDASWIACLKGLAAGTTNLLLALALGAAWPGAANLSVALLVGFGAYGVSLALFVVALRHLGASRAGAYFSTAPFVGALAAVVFLAEPVTWQLLSAALLMAAGLWLHLTERHAHEHLHQPMMHEHAHAHPDAEGHHDHAHVPAFEGQHSHPHQHEPLRHSHAHYPDAHHRHGH